MTPAGAGAAPLLCVDSSVAIAGFAAWHEDHNSAAEVLRTSPQIPAHAAIETYSVLTRLPDPHRAEPAIVEEYIARTFPRDKPSLAADHQSRLVSELANAGVSGGAVYDAIVALSASELNLTLVSLDRRAARTYRALSVAFELLG